MWKEELSVLFKKNHIYIIQETFLWKVTKLGTKPPQMDHSRVSLKFPTLTKAK